MLRQWFEIHPYDFLPKSFALRRYLSKIFHSSANPPMCLLQQASSLSVQ
ncbi:hypothetical protein ILFOPFJJ_06991 [Ensifer psoraleae]|nr:hypothetical protein [Sinorhizobium psoraleae]